MRKKLMVLLGFAGVFLFFPEVVHADNCSFFMDCFNTARAAAAAAAAMGIIAAIASAAADLTPGVGEVKAGTQLITGEDPFTHKKVPRWESAIGLIPVFGRVAARGLRFGMAAARAAKAMEAARGLRGAARGLKTGIEVYETVRKPYDIGKTVKDTSYDIAGQLDNYFKSQQGHMHVGTGRGAGAKASAGSEKPQVSEAHLVEFDHNITKVLVGGFQSVEGNAPAAVANETLKNLEKTYGKDSQTLKSLAKAKDKLEALPKDATMKDAVEKLKG